MIFSSSNAGDAFLYLCIWVFHLYFGFLYDLEVHMAPKLVVLKCRRNIVVQGPRPPQTIGKPLLSKDCSSSQIIFPQINIVVQGPNHWQASPLNGLLFHKLYFHRSKITFWGHRCHAVKSNFKIIQISTFLGRVAKLCWSTTEALNWHDEPTNR